MFSDNCTERKCGKFKFEIPYNAKDDSDWWER